MLGGTTSPLQRDIKIKICGITSIGDARLAADSGVDYIGVIVGVDFSLRCLTVEQARLICEQASLPVVVLVCNWTTEEIQSVIATLNPYAVQLLGQESPSLVKTLKGMAVCELWKVIHLPPQGMEDVDVIEIIDRANSLVDIGVDAIVIDTVVSSPGGSKRYGGTGQVSNWAIARQLVDAISVPTFLAGGINPENVQQAIGIVHPYGIDLCSGVERIHGRKDAEKLRRLISVARGVS